MRIYRIEHPNHNLGPFGGRCRTIWEKHDGHAPNDGPSPYQDIPGWNSPGPSWIFGCVSLQQLREWFHKPHLDAMKPDGWMLAEYDVPAWQIRKGESQVCFNRDHSRLINRFDLDYVQC